MSGFVAFLPALPLAGFLFLVLLGHRCPRRIVALIGVGPTLLSAIVASALFVRFVSHTTLRHETVTLWTWMHTGAFSPSVSFLIDPLCLVMVLTVTWVSFLILLYSVPYMAGDRGYARFFAYMSLFVGSMLLLVLADNLFLLYLGWEGVGLCSYLLIGFWYEERKNTDAAFKAFFITRIGDVALLLAILIIFVNCGTLHIEDAMSRASDHWIEGSRLANGVACLILIGAIGKSAQLPLQTWLPDAMAGPTPVSALIHAATMVTAGVYLIARTHTFFSLAPAVHWVVAAIGAITLLVAGWSALFQRDIKRVLAYSTMSQVGYMFLALGVGSWIAAVFHLVTHAFFKALLFLSAGFIIEAMDDERDIYHMGGLRKPLPFAFWTFLIGAASLSAVPFFGGFFSKDLILSLVGASSPARLLLLAGGLAGALITAVYIFRVFFIVFYGPATRTPVGRHLPAAAASLLALSVLAVLGGYVETPSFLGDVHLFSRFLGKSLPSVAMDGGIDAILAALSCATSLGGVLLAYLTTRRRSLSERHGIPSPMARFFRSGWGFDTVYAGLIVRPFLYLARLGRGDVIDLFYRSLAWGSTKAHQTLSMIQTGSVRWYAMAMAVGAILFIGMVILL